MHSAARPRVRIEAKVTRGTRRGPLRGGSGAPSRARKLGLQTRKRLGHSASRDIIQSNDRVTYQDPEKIADCVRLCSGVELWNARRFAPGRGAIDRCLRVSAGHSHFLGVLKEERKRAE